QHGNRVVMWRLQRFARRIGGEALADLNDLVAMVGAWASGRYRRMSTSSLLAALGALIYFLMPVDSVPDFLPALGFVDDIAIVARVMKMFRKDIDAFRQWRAEQEEGQQ
ncbi:MAG: YkvA family protein, partial [Alcanivoracaceae bacterium]